MGNENITCEFCKKVKRAFINIETNKSMFCQRFNCCVDCFKNKDIDEVIRLRIEKELKDLVEHHNDKIEELKLQAKKEASS